MVILDLGDDVRIGVRDGAPGDHDFVQARWLQKHKSHGDWPPRVEGCCGLSGRRYYDLHKRTVARILAASRLIVACNPEAPAQIIGFAVADDKALHWVTRKAAFQGHSIGGQLVAAAIRGRGITRATHWTQSANIHGPAWGVTYDPFLLREYEE